MIFSSIIPVKVPRYPPTNGICLANALILSSLPKSSLVSPPTLPKSLPSATLVAPAMLFANLPVASVALAVAAVALEVAAVFLLVVVVPAVTDLL